MFRVQSPLSAHITAIHHWVAPLRSVNSYGLFAVMTTSRSEIILEGSDDGVNWLAYEIKYKPGAPTRRPAFVAPHQPRLDWQMWFATLGTARQNPRFGNLVMRLLEGSPEVVALLERNPFPAKPPRYLRAVKYMITGLQVSQSVVQVGFGGGERSGDSTCRWCHCSGKRIAAYHMLPTPSPNPIQSKSFTPLL